MAKVFGHGDTGQSTKVSEGDFKVIGTEPTLTVGDGGEEDAIIMFEGAAVDFHIASDDSADSLVIGTGTTIGSNWAIQIDGTAGDITIRRDVVIGGTTPTLTIGDAGAEDAAIVFDGNAQDFYVGLDDTADNLVIGKGSTLGTTQYAAFTAANTEGFMYKPHAIQDTGTSGTTLTAAQSGTTVILSNSSGYVTLPDGGTTDYGMQFVIINGTTSNNTGAIRRAGSTDSFYDSDTTGGETGNQAVGAMKAKTVIYAAQNVWIVIG